MFRPTSFLSRGNAPPGSRTKDTLPALTTRTGCGGYCGGSRRSGCCPPASSDLRLYRGNLVFDLLALDLISDQRHF